MPANVVQKVRNYLKNQQWTSYLVILPTSHLVNSFIVQVLDDDEIRGVLYPQIYSFDSFIEEVIKSAPVKLNLIGEVIKEEILRSVILKLINEQQLIYMADARIDYGLINSVGQTITELKQNCISPEELKQAAEKLSSPKILDIAVIYAEYQDILQKAGLSDNEDRFIKVLSWLKNNEISLFQEFEYFAADWFIDATHIQKMILEEISFKAKDRDLLLCEFGRDLARDIIKIIEKYHFGDKPGHLALSLFAADSEESVQPEVSLHKGWSREGEVRCMARIVLNQIRAGVPLQEIAVVCRDPAGYAGYLQQVMSETGIPLVMEYKKPLRTNPLAQSLLLFLKMANNRNDGIDLVQLVQNPYICGADSCSKILAEVAAKYGHMNSEELLINCRQELQDIPAISDEERQKCSQRLERVISILNSIPLENSRTEIIRAVKAAFGGIRADQNIVNIGNIAEVEKRVKIVGRDIRAWENVVNIIEQMEYAAAFAHDNGDYYLEDFIKELGSYMQNVEYPVSRNTDDGLRVYSPGEIRGLNFHTVIVLGMQEGEFPRHISPGWVINDRERISLLNYDISLPLSYEIYEREKLLYYLTVQASNEKLFLVYSSIDSEGQTALPSLFVQETERLLGTELPVVEPDPVLPDNIRDLVSIREMLLFLLANAYTDEAYKIMEEYGLNADIIKYLLMVDRERNKEYFSCWDGYFTDEAVIKAVEEKNREKIFSISMMDSYAKCPMRYFFAQELKLNPVPEVEEGLAPIDIGSLEHEVMAKVLPVINKDNKEKIRELVEKELNDLCQEKNLDGWQYAHPVLWDLEKQDIIKVLTNVAEKEIDRGSYVPHKFEWEFGIEDEPLILNTPAGEVRFKGIIDRIDKGKDNRYAVYDYKRSSGASKQAILSGRSLQLPVYLLAVKQLLQAETDGAGYISFKEGNVQSAVFKDSCKKDLGMSPQTKGLSDEQWQQFMENSLNFIGTYYQGIKKANFSINPADCSYCDFADICFYDRQRIAKKVRGGV